MTDPASKPSREAAEQVRPGTPSKAPAAQASRGGGRVRRAALRAWLSPVTHCIAGVVVAVVVVMFWLDVHRKNRPRYDLETEPALVSALASYQVVLADGEQILQLQQDGKEFRVADEPAPGALGIGRLPGIRGVLVRYSALIENYNRRLRRRAAAWRSQWTEQGNAFRLPFASLLPGAARTSELVLLKQRVAGSPDGSLLIKGLGAMERWLLLVESAQLYVVPESDRSQAAPLAWLIRMLRAPLATFEDWSSRRLTPAESDRSQAAPLAWLIRLLRAPVAAFEVWSSRQGLPAKAASASDKFAQEDAAPVPRGLVKLVDYQAQRLPVRASRLAGESTIRVPRSLSGNERRDVRAQMLAPFHADVLQARKDRGRVYQELQDLARRVEKEALDDDGEPCDGLLPRAWRWLWATLFCSPASSPTAEQLSVRLAPRLHRWTLDEKEAEQATLGECVERVRRHTNASLACELYTVTLSESGYLWFFGAWKWLEVLWWTWFGVLAMGLFQVTSLTVYGRGLDGSRWDPRDSFKMLARGFYAPLLAIVFFWLAIATDLVDEKSVLATNTFGVLAAAFLIGLAPNHLLRLLLSTLKVLVRGGENPERAKEQKAPLVREVKVPARKADGQVLTVRELGETIKKVTLGPLE